MFETVLSLLLLPVGFALGWAMCRKSVESLTGATRPSDAAPMSAADLSGDADDSAVVALTHAAAQDPRAIELQMALAALCRKRGEVERAIRLHEALADRDDLTVEQTAAARYELAQDYLRAGLIDRAESILEHLIDHGPYLSRATELLLELYEQGREWTKAISVAQQLQGIKGVTQAARIAQYHCELADSARHGGDSREALAQVQRALEVDRASPRALQLLGVLAEARQDWQGAIRAYTQLVERAPIYAVEAIEPLTRCHAQLGDTAGFKQLLDDFEHDQPKLIPVILTKATRLAADEGPAVASRYLAERGQTMPGGRLYLAWVGLTLANDTTAQTLTAAMTKRFDARPRYRCDRCGLQPSVLFWQCPSCKNWASIIPAPDPI